MTLASGSYDKTVKLWDTQTGQENATLTGHGDWVSSVAFSLDGMTLASASYDKTVKLWDTQSGQESATLTGHGDAVLSVAFSPDGMTLASASKDRTIKLWDARSGQERATLTGHGSYVYSVTFSPDGMTLASASLENLLNDRKDGNPVFGSAIKVHASTDNTFEIRGPVNDSVFYFHQHDGNTKKFKWSTTKTNRFSRFYVDPDSGNFIFEGGDLVLTNKGKVLQRVISATEKPSHNLRGINIDVDPGVENMEVYFQKQELDAKYSITVQTNWNTNNWVSEKRTNGFTVNFSNTAGRNAKIDWQLIR
jgi:WD40 repeat protein